MGGQQSEQTTIWERVPGLMFWAAALAAVVAIRIWNRDQWFFLDEWESLAGRQLSSPSDLLRPHNEHWSTVPIVSYRLVWNSVGLHHYWPYQAVTLAFHVLAAAMVRSIAQRSGADAWVATACGLVMLWFGAGRDAIAWGINGFTIAIAFGLSAIVLTDRSKSWLGDLVAAAACTLALMSSGIGIGFVVAVALVGWTRRGWRAALVGSLPPVAAQTIWQLIYGKAPLRGRPTLGQAAEMAWRVIVDLSATLGGITQVGVVIVLSAAIGLVVGRRRDGRWAEWRPVVPALGALSTGAVSLVLVATGRAAFDVEPAGRYLYLFAALILPLLAVGLTELSANRTWVTVAAALLLCVGIPANAQRMRPAGEVLFTLGNSTELVGYATAPSLRTAPADFQPLGQRGRQVTVAWLRSIAGAGKVPDPGPAERAVWPTAELAYALPPVPQGGELGECQAVEPGQPILLRRADVIVVDGDQAHVTRLQGAPAAVSIGRLLDSQARYLPGNDVRFYVREAVGRVSIRGDRPSDVVRICSPD